MSLLKQIWSKKHLYAFLVPTMVLLLIFEYWPPISAMITSFYDWDGMSAKVWVGFENFIGVFQDKAMRAAVLNLFKLTGFGLAVGLSVPLLVAELIYNLRRDRQRYLYRLIFILPMVVPGLVGMLLWRFILDSNFGLLNAILVGIGGPDWAQDWFGSQKTALLSFMIMGFPYVGGVNVLIYLAGLQGIPQEIFDAGLIDGATGLQRFRYVDLPLLMGQIKLLLILGVIGGLQNYSAQLILTDGGPGYATMMPGLVMYHEAFAYSRVGFASAIGFLTFLVILAFTYINMKYVRSTTELTA